MPKGTFIISIDTEMAWGTYDHGGDIRFKDAYDQYRSIIHRILYLFKKYDISATWAIVGHLFLEECGASNVTQSPHWFGKDIIRLIKEASPFQEIASHSFSHMVFSDPNISKETVRAEVERCVSIAAQENLSLESFVFPRNQIGHLDLLSEFGFKTYRYHPQGSRGFLYRGIHLLKDMLPITPPVFEVFTEEKTHMTAIPASFHFRYAYGASAWIPPKVRFIKAQKGLEKASKENKIFHLWFHPIDFAWKERKIFLEFEEILKVASSLRKEGKLNITPMKNI